MILALIPTSVSDLLFLPPIGVVMIPTVDASSLPLVQPRNVVVGHPIGYTTGIIILHMLGLTAIVAVAAVGAVFVPILPACAAHSPVTATAMVIALMPHGHGPTNDFRFIGFISASSIMIVVFGIPAN